MKTIATVPATSLTRSCPRCGLTEAVLNADGRLGCPQCYVVFADLVEQAVIALHGAALSPGAVAAPPPTAKPPQAPPAPPAPLPDTSLPWPTRRAAPAPPAPPSTAPRRPNR